MSEQITRRWATTLMVGCGMLVAATTAIGLSSTLRRVTGLERAPRALYSIGDPFDIQDRAGRAIVSAVVVVTKNGCRACETSAPAIASIVRAAAARPGAHVFLLTQAPRNTAELEYAAAVEIHEDQVVFTDLAAHALRVAPTVIGVDSAGRVSFVREGPVTDADATAIIRNLVARLPVLVDAPFRALRDRRVRSVGSYNGSDASSPAQVSRRHQPRCSDAARQRRRGPRTAGPGACSLGGFGLCTTVPPAAARGALPRGEPDRSGADGGGHSCRRRWLHVARQSLAWVVVGRRLLIPHCGVLARGDRARGGRKAHGRRHRKASAIDCARHALSRHRFCFRIRGSMGP